LRIIADTNLLVRALVADDPGQAARAQAELTAAERIALSSVALCELAWVLAARYNRSATEIGAAIRGLIDAENVAVDRAAAEAGLAMLAAGADFADGVIAHEGAWLGGETFVSFDRRAVSRVNAMGRAAREPV
jgi:predicted nucleic-acid-binding protein